MPVSTRRQARAAQQAHAVSHLNLNNLPAEIIQEIASHLRPDWYESESDDSDFSDRDYDDMSVYSVEAEDDPLVPKVLPCCRSGDSKASEGESRIPILDDEAKFSATSKRIRDIVFHRPQRRRKTIRYCEQWRRETMRTSEAVRRRYKKLRFLANQKHRTDPQRGQLVSLLRCFPNLTTASISWTILFKEPYRGRTLKRTREPIGDMPNLQRLQILLHPDWIGDARSGPEAHGLAELRELFTHLPLVHVKKLGVFFEDFVNSEMTYLEPVILMFQQVTRAMRFPALQSFHLGFAYHVFGVPTQNLWEFLEKLIEPIFQATKITKISLRPRFMFDCADEVQRNVFTATEQGQMLHHDFLPSREDLRRWVYRLKARYNQLETFILDLSYAILDGDNNQPTDDTFLMLEYHDIPMDTDDYTRPVIRDNMDLRDSHVYRRSRRFQYTIYPETIEECHKRLVSEAEALRRQDELDAAAARDARDPLVVPDTAETGDASDGNAA